MWRCSDNLHAFQLVWFAGIIELVGGVSLFTIGLFTRAAAFIMSGEMAIAYFRGATLPNGFFPILNSGEGAVLYCFLFFYFFLVGGGPPTASTAPEPEPPLPVDAEGRRPHHSWRGFVRDIRMTEPADRRPEPEIIPPGAPLPAAVRGFGRRAT